jgi:hypothetical protein
MKRHVVFFQAIIKNLTQKQCSVYFEALFKTFKIEANSFLGTLMDFSVSQRLGFQDACQSVFGMTYAQSLSFIKGCYMHWMSSVECIKKNFRVVPADKSQEFMSLTYKLQKTTHPDVFLETGGAILSNFPNARDWLVWWLQPSICSMIFQCKTVMKEDLRKHPFRTSNAVESYHSVLYRLIPKRQPLAVGLRLLLQVAKRDGLALCNYFHSGVRPTYGTKTRKPRTKNLIKFIVNDGRAPDNNATLFPKTGPASKKRKDMSDGEDDSRDANHYEYFTAETKKKVTEQEQEKKVAYEEDIDLYLTEELKKGASKLDEMKVGLLDVDEEIKFIITEELDDEVKHMLKGNSNVFLTLSYR